MTDSAARRGIISDEDVKEHVENRADKKASDRCVRRCCKRSPADDSDYCPRHRDEQRGYQRDYMARRREEWDADDRCTNCGAKERKTGSNWCPRCLIARGKAHRAVVKSQVENRRDRIAERLIPWENSPSNEGRVRLRGGKRGAPKAEQADEMDLHDLRLYVERAADGLHLAGSPEVQALPRLQRDDAKDAALAWIALLIRAGLALLKRKRYPLPSQFDHVLGGEMVGTDE